MEKFIIPKEIEVEIYVNLFLEGFKAGEFKASCYDFSDSEYQDENINVLKVTKKIDLTKLKIDDKSIRTELAEKYRQQIKQIQAESYKKEREVQDKLNNLLAIEYKQEPITATECEERIKQSFKQHPKKNTIGG